MGVDIKTELAKLTIEQLQDVAKPASPPVGDADVTKTKLLAIIAKLREVELHGGIHRIASAENVPAQWVKQVDQLRKEVLVEKAPKEIIEEIE